ncbi:hypothetical protein BK136_30515, partial [Paenibacillus amylolyticus]
GYASFRIRSIKDFAEEKVEAGTWAEEEAQQLAEESYERYLPEGLNTPGAYLYNTDASCGRKCGVYLV